MSIIVQQQLQQQIGTQFAAGVREPVWGSARMIFSEVAGRGWSSQRVMDESGERLDAQPVRRPKGFADLRREMADPVTGAWWAAELTVTSTGGMTWRFEYDRRVYWHGGTGTPLSPPEHGDVQPTLDDYLQDLVDYPRSDENIPEWLRDAPRNDGPENEPIDLDSVFRGPAAAPPAIASLVRSASWARLWEATRIATEQQVRDAASAGLLQLTGGTERMRSELEGLIEFIVADVVDEVTGSMATGELESMVREIGPVADSRLTMPDDPTDRTALLDPVNTVAGSATSEYLSARFGIPGI